MKIACIVVGFVLSTIAGSSAASAHMWAPGVSAVGTYDEAKSRCAIAARHSGSGFRASGSTAFVAGAAVVSAIGDSIRSQNDFDDCMRGSGWVVVDDSAIKSVADVKVLLASIKDDAKECVAAVRADPQFAPIVPHLSNPDTGKYSFVQMSDESVPSAEDGRLVALYEDGAEPCRQKIVSRISALSPRDGAVLARTYRIATDVVLLLIARKITWGENARRLQAAIDSHGASEAPKAP